MLKYKAELPHFKLELLDSLNLHEDNLFVLFKGGHYDIVYHEKCPLYDTPFIQITKAVSIVFNYFVDHQEEK